MAEHPPIPVRPARLDDHPAIVALSARVFAAYGPYGEVVPAWLARPEVEALVAELDGRFAGVVILSRTTSGGRAACELLAVGVVEDLQGRGVGTALVQAGLAQVRRWPGPPVRSVHLSTAADNDVALRLFRRLGFEPTGELRGCYQGGQPIVSHRLRLGPSRDEG